MSSEKIEKFWIFVEIFTFNRRMSSRKIEKKVIIRKIKIRKYIQCYGFKK